MKKVWAWPLTHGKGRTGEVLKNQPKVEHAKETPPICYGKRDAQYNLQQGGEVPTHGREDKIVNLRFTHDGAKFFDSEA